MCSWIWGIWCVTRSNIQSPPPGLRLVYIFLNRVSHSVSVLRWWSTAAARTMSYCSVPRLISRMSPWIVVILPLDTCLILCCARSSMGLLRSMRVTGVFGRCWSSLRV